MAIYNPFSSARLETYTTESYYSGTALRAESLRVGQTFTSLNYITGQVDSFSAETTQLSLGIATFPKRVSSQYERV